jgi:pimeloyl-ACP methyl ester carboxylesterase
LSPEALKAGSPETFAALKQRVAYPIDAYRVVYRTPDLRTGDTIEVSGALFVPDVDEAVPTISYQHGTIYPFEGDVKAPSNHDGRSAEVALCRLLAAQGYVVAAPDYIGYGASRDRSHPYYLLDSHARTTWNLLRATEELATTERAGERTFALDGRLLLTGYSQGGSTSMALHRRMEAEGDSTFQLTASVNGGGVYHLPQFMEAVLAKQDLGTAQSDAGDQILNVYLWVIDTYLDHYDALQRSWADVVQAPYAAKLDTARSVFEVDIPSKPAVVFQNDFRAGIETREDTALVRVLEANSNYRWSPEAPARLVHGTADNIVPFANARAALQSMHSRGAQTVDLIPVDGAGHGDTFSRYLEVLVGSVPEREDAAQTASGTTSSHRAPSRSATPSSKAERP